MKKAALVSFLCVSSFVCGVSAQITPGTVLPVMLVTPLSTTASKPGQRIVAKVMEDVPLPDNGRVPTGTTVRGEVVAVSAATKLQGAKLSFRITQLEYRDARANITSNLRALASDIFVRSALIPISGTRDYAVEGWSTELIGGGVGNSAYGGGLTSLIGTPPCRGEVDGNTNPQALWVFSPAACGIYGFRDRISIQHSGRTEPMGEITLTATKGNIKLASRTGMLIRVDRSPARVE